MIVYLKYQYIHKLLIYNVPMNNFEDKAILREILPKTGLVYSERGGLTETLCKPKMMPLKSLVLEQLQKIESSVNDKTNEKSKAEN